MRKSTLYLILGLAVLAAGTLTAVLWGLGVLGERDLPVGEILADYRGGADFGGLTIRYPRDATVFPPEIAPPTFLWEPGEADAGAWIVAVHFPDEARERVAAAATVAEWTPSDAEWQAIRQGSLRQPARVTVLGVDRRGRDRVVSAASISIRTSEDEVGAPIFYREVNLPFIEAVKDPSRIRWRFGSISCREQPPIVLEKLPVCGNCHSFSADGEVLGLDVDYANDKGSYAVDEVAEELVLHSGNIITWSDFRREDGEPTFGLLSQVSPDGRYVVSTVKDRSVFVPRDDLAFSQLFFPIKGILAVYDRQTERFFALPGADDKRFVQSNATWSPDGKHILFARAKMHQLEDPVDPDAVLLDEEACAEFLAEGKPFPFDLYRIPFNEGRGGEAKPIPGASHNGRSNYFARYSPDGRWIVFCQAESFMLLQPDSELFIMPAEGGEPRRLRCNTPRMNSWHSWSPNGKWLVFSSKWLSIYTQLFLTHVDEQGRTTPPVLLARFTAPDRAANIPEFVNARPDAIRRISERFVDDASLVRAGLLNAQQGFHDDAVREFRQALAMNPENVDAHVGLGASLAQLGQFDEAESHLRLAIRRAPDHARAHESLGIALAEQGRLAEAAESFRQSVRLDPERPTAQFRLGIVCMDLGDVAEAREHLAEAVRLDPDDPRPLCSLGVALAHEGRPEAAAKHFVRALRLNPNLGMALVGLASIRLTADDPALRNAEQAAELALRASQLSRHRDPSALALLSQAYAELGRVTEAASTAERAVQAALATGNAQLAETLRQSLEQYRRQAPGQAQPR